MSFVGAWRVSEAVYDAEGTFLGRVRQHRRLEEATGDRLRVTQVCEPDQRLIGHPMATFAGEHQFELAVDGRLRHYLGPAVLGSGIAFGEGAMIGDGIWPDFGYNFSSWAVLTTPERQLTGGRFHVAGREIAMIVGLAVPDSGVWPCWPPPEGRGETAAQRWQGTLIEVDDTGREAARKMTRDERGGGWSERTSGRRSVMDLTRDGDRLRLTGTGGRTSWTGFARRFGPLLRYEAVAGDAIIRGLETVDAAGRLAGMRRWFRHGRLDRTEVFRLQPD